MNEYRVLSDKWLIAALSHRTRRHTSDIIGVGKLKELQTLLVVFCRIDGAANVVCALDHSGRLHHKRMILHHVGECAVGRLAEIDLQITELCLSGVVCSWDGNARLKWIELIALQACQRVVFQLLQQWLLDGRFGRGEEQRGR